MKSKLVCLIGWLLTCSLASAQSFTFADTHPVKNVDSLEQWLAANPKAPALVRLRNLIALERTYVWTNRNKIGSHVTERVALAKALKIPVAQAANAYLQAERSLYEEHYPDMVQQANAALKQFAALQDTSGLVHAHAILVAVNAMPFGGSLFKDVYKLGEEHLRIIETKISSRDDPHDWLTCQKWRYRQAYMKISNGQLIGLIIPVLQRIQQTPACQYASYTFFKYKAVAFNITGKLQMSLQLDLDIAARLKPDQLDENATIQYNLAINYEDLHRPDNSIASCQKSIGFARRCSPANFNLIKAAYQLMRKMLAEKGNYRLANQMADSCQVYEDSTIDRRTETRAAELETQFAVNRRQQENMLLRQQEALSKAQRQNVTIALGATVVILLLIAFFAIRLYQNRNKLRQANRQLEDTLTEVRQLNKAREHFIGIIAHDMRKPLVSFRGLADVISMLLKQKAYQDIGQVSQAIDSAGLAIETMLDNLLKWALAQREAIPYHPQTLRLAPALSQVVGLYQTLVQFQAITLSWWCAEGLIVWADPNGLDLIVRNLIDNALKQVGAGGQILLEATSGVDGQVEIRISDSGSGIRPDRLVFLQSVLSGEVKGEVGQHGLGLGLLLVRDFVVKNQGSIRFESEVGQGSSFILNLPAGQPALAMSPVELKPLEV